MAGCGIRCFFLGGIRDNPRINCGIRDDKFGGMRDEAFTIGNKLLHVMSPNYSCS